MKALPNTSSQTPSKIATKTLQDRLATEPLAAASATFWLTRRRVVRVVNNSKEVCSCRQIKIRRRHNVLRLDRPLSVEG